MNKPDYSKLRNKVIEDFKIGRNNERKYIVYLGVAVASNDKIIKNLNNKIVQGKDEIDV